MWLQRVACRKEVEEVEKKAAEPKEEYKWNEIFSSRNEIVLAWFLIEPPTSLLAILIIPYASQSASRVADATVGCR